MIHSSFHFCIGVGLITLLLLPRLRRAWRNGGSFAGIAGRWLLLSYAAGIWAILPSLLRRAGLPDAICDGWWMNICCFYPLVNRLPGRLTIIGQAGLAFTFAAQYAVLLLAIRRHRRPSDSSRQPAA